MDESKHEEGEHEKQQPCWQCYLCANPDRALDLNEDHRPLLQGQLKEKHGKWKFFRRWHKRVFTLTGSNIVYFKKDMVRPDFQLFSLKIIFTNFICLFFNLLKSGKKV